ncbi:MAG: hypothetical protein HY714_06810 [Candidatus Omnitrophica bacterium]|nr:hypothetical protein [Candidatus Omnitrophota bacterium]
MFLNLGERIDLKLLRRALVALSGAACLAIIVDQVPLSLHWSGPPSPVRRSIPRDLFHLKPENWELPDEFQGSWPKRDLFNRAGTGQGVGEVKKPLRERVRNFRLKGIALFTVPEGIVEDAATGRSVFVKEGERLGGALVTDIKEESVVLSYDGEELELKIQGGKMQ